MRGRAGGARPLGLGIRVPVLGLLLGWASSPHLGSTGVIQVESGLVGQGHTAEGHLHDESWVEL